MDAFVALGGQADKEGFIDAARLIQIIKNEFEMTIDIEKLIEDIDEDGSGQIEYDEFMSLLSSSDWMVPVITHIVAVHIISYTNKKRSTNEEKRVTDSIECTSLIEIQLSNYGSTGVPSFSQMGTKCSKISPGTK